MTQSKWEKVRSSPVDISQIDTGTHSLQGDWKRELAHPTTINGTRLAEYAISYNNFNSLEDVTLFFNEVILKDMTFANEQEKENVNQFLQSSFHQGCFLDPLSAAICHAMKEKTAYKKLQDGQEVEVEEVIPYATLTNPHKLLEIVTTKTGFTIHQTMTAKTLMKAEVYFEQHHDENDEESEDRFFKPDGGKDYVIRARGKLELDFSNFSKNDNLPKITVLENNISYGNTIIERKLDHRSLMQMLTDLIKWLFLRDYAEIKEPPTAGTSTDNDTPVDSYRP